MGANFASKPGPPTVIWIHHEGGVQFDLDLKTIRMDLSCAGIQFVEVTNTPDAIREASSIGGSVRCVVQNMIRKQSKSGIEFIRRLQDLSGRARRSVPVMVLSQSVLASEELQTEVASMGETAADFDPTLAGGYIKLLRWIVKHCVGIEKEVLFVRHAEAWHNATRNYDLPDPALTEDGEKQALALAAVPSPEVLRAQLIVTSPLRRTLQTTQIAFGNAGLPVLVLPMIQEVGPSPCDTGSEKAALEEWFDKVSLFSFHGLPEGWNLKEGVNCPGRVYERISRFVAWLRQRKETSIIVVTHGTFVKRLILGHPSHKRVPCSWEILHPFANCESRPFWLLANGSWVAAPPALLPAPAGFTT